jgi:tetratricopeptide (TPR) repeat protein
MMIEQHYDEEVLAEFLAEPRDAVSRDKHLASCELCLGSLDTLRATAHTLKEPAVWGPPISTTPRPETLAFLRGVAKTMAEEDATAAVWIKELLAGPRDGWAARLAEHPEWRTGGMVRRLIASVEDAINTVPTDGVEIAAIAVSIAASLTTPNARHLQGLSHYYQGYAFWYTGAISEALLALDNADERLRTVVAGEVDRARVQLMRAMLYQILERLDESMTIAGAAADVFERHDDRDRFAAARSVSATTLQAAQRFRDAIAIHQEIAEAIDISDRWRLSAVHNMALCYSEIGEFDKAVACLLRSIDGYQRLGMITSRLKSRWVLADTFARQGRHADALPLYEDLKLEFEELGMSNDVALVSLDAAESLLVSGRMSEIADVCRTAISYFVRAGLSQTEPSLRGLAYLQEAAASGRVTPAAVRDVRAFLLAPLEHSALLFAEPLQ